MKLREWLAMKLWPELWQEYLDISYLLSCVAEHATGGRLSKTNYLKETYYIEIDDYINQCCEEYYEEMQK